jgi:hypothetical protein
MAIGGKTREQDKKIFARVAKNPPIGLGVWILVRGANEKSLADKYMLDRVHYTPKPIDCKAKTAKEGPCAGLVVNPHQAERAFSGCDLVSAIRVWDEKKAAHSNTASSLPTTQSRAGACSKAASNSTASTFSATTT